MKRVALLSAIGLWAACGSEAASEAARDAAVDAPNDPRAVGDPPSLADVVARDATAEPQGGGGEAAAIDVPADAPTAPLDVPLDVSFAERPMVVDVASVDHPATGDRPAPLDGANANCQDRVVGYDDPVLGAYMSEVTSLAFSPDGTRLAATIAHSYTSWDLGGGTDGGAAAAAGGGLDGGTCNGPWPTCPAPITSVAYLPDGRLAGRFCGGQFIIFGCKSPNFLSSFAVSPIGNLVADARTPIQLWDTWSSQPVKTFASGGAALVAFSPDGTLLVGGVVGVGVRVWDVASGAELTNLPVTAAPTDVVQVRVSPDGRWIGALYAGQVRIWNLHTYAEVATFIVDPLSTNFAFTRDGGSVITGGSRVNVHAVADGSLLYQMGARTYVVEVSPDGSTVAASGDVGVPINLYCLY